MKLTIDIQEIEAVHLSEEAQRQVLVEMEKYCAAVDLEADLLRQTYHLGRNPTAGRGFNDCLVVRLGLSRSTLMRALVLYESATGKRGWLRSVRAGGKYLVSERACRDWEAASKKRQPA
jgi:hypothetical protein